MFLKKSCSKNLKRKREKSGKLIMRKFKDFVCLLGTVILRKNFFVLTGKDHIHSIRDFDSKPICSQFNNTFYGLERSFQESSSSEAFAKTREVLNNALT